MNLAIFGLLTFVEFGMCGGVLLMLMHGITSSALFLIVGFLYERFYTRLVYYYSGLVYLMPVFSCIFLFLLITNSGFPGLCNFIGELLIFISLFKINLILS
jgi:NADH-quinone oxidoreductase subunit M